MAEPAPILLFDAALRGALVALALLLIAKLVRDRTSSAAAHIGIALLAGLIVQALTSIPAVEASPPSGWHAPLIGLSVGNAVLFFLFSLSLFDDEFEPRRLHLALWVAVVALGTLFYVVVVMRQQLKLAPFPLAVAIAMRWTPIVFGVLAVGAAARQWRIDLIERRRRLRGWIVGAGCLYTVATAAARIASGDGRLSEMAASADIAVLLGLVAVIAWVVLQPSGATDLLPPRRQPSLPPPAVPGPAVVPPPAAAAPSDPAEDRLAEQLQRLMAEDRAYRDEKLGIASLAAKLRAPEYRLRRLINQRLGHRNFSAYVNGFRLDEARRALADPTQREVPVLTIALDAGFGSIGPFNRAFKAATGLTPTEFRRKQLADS